MDRTLHDPLVGQVLDGRYRVEARIAVGGMATVYRAVDTRLDRVLALKVMHPSLAVDELFVDRFIREAKSAARLAHPNVVAVFDQGTDGGYVYLAMEYVAGRTLRDLLRERGALRPRAAFDVLEPMLSALGAAHHAGLVHRDMKPENVLIGDDGSVKVADFGLVRTVDGQTSSSTGQLMGTISYLAPEQIEDGVSDPRSDLYACGVLLYEMLTGAKPHSPGTPAAVLYQHLHEGIPAPSGLVPGLAPQLDELVARTTARAPADRPDDALALLAEVRTARAALTGEQLEALPPGARTDAEHGDRTLSLGCGNGGGDGRSAGDAEATSVLPYDTAVTEPVPYGPGTRREGGAGTDHTTAELGVVAPDGAGPGAAGPGAVGLGAVGLADFAGDDTAEHGADAAGTAPPGGHAGGPGRGPWRPSLLVLTGVLLVLLLGGGAWYLTSGQSVKTPAVLDMTEAEARETLEEAGLDVDVERDHSLRVQRGRVIETSPAPGETSDGDVTIVVSRGPEIVKVPDLAGMPLDEARAKLKGVGLDPGIVTREFDAETARGSVLRTKPDAGTEKRPGSAVALTVSKGEVIPAPDLVGDDEDDARDALEELGLKVRVAQQRVFSDEDEGKVAEQSPSEDAPLAEGDTVTLTLSKGQDMVSVPDVGGQDADEAREALEDAGFSVKVRKLFFADRVFNQSPEGGDEAPRGSEVTIWVR
ncbi:PASTA domain-containing protein [Streptomyces sp. Z26]|uniref:Stk1 family PASTA domain-containing Ser/Thr kinase n=1 Tax=Streptomyces sp. Z26 TaxID=2500177 RepID=UPI000EF16436|nr:PASTA domain-containing protein [Streptomyces sp. Z26]RLL66412.1 serine/threonine protein kinase [Streptomyces sp. Z26]